ncbi:chitin-binding protein [Xylanibacillus composti]|uniref:Chitin-binding type-3 domain-containing protein n=1 Tax=Xylanibacillus composti TaxID=1572762 RepID=A0A8J4H0T0_9BACL|nr:lytic polysaccharide monooxygenase [Xylanibacillus composti]MDT9723889.1 chitin-binding protein [Xylanibacillus composti]GIQ67332.1 hypothetical protein XYCOK13_01560 [Xylanibacillus composti]
MTALFAKERKLSKTNMLVAAAGIALLLFACSLLFANSADAHGYVQNSRAHLCQLGINTNCGQVQYEPFSVEGRGDFPEIGVPDGRIASANGGTGAAPFYELDVQTATRWSKINLQGGPHTFRWVIQANHATNNWKYYITKKGWNPNEPLARANLELFCEYRDHGANPPLDYSSDCFIPNDREGYHVIVAVWDIFDTQNAFYQAIDVNLSINPSAPTTPPPGHPGDPNRFGEIEEWVSIRPYQAGEIVRYNGAVWEAVYYSRGVVPGTNNAWRLVDGSPNNPNPGPNPGQYPAWNPNTVYTNEIVSHNGQLWQAQWWTQGQEPGTTGQWGPWRLVTN